MTAVPDDSRRWRPLSLWRLLHEPRAITLLHMIGYTVLAVGGIVALTHPPTSVQAEWGPVLASAWAWALILGGIIALASTPRGIWVGERIGITALAAGLGMYLSVVLNLHLTSTGNRLPQAAVIVYAICSLAIRWQRIRHAALDPLRGPDGYHPPMPGTDDEI